MSTEVDTTYNGWRNHETWNVALWLGNDEGLYHATRDLVRDALESTSVVSGQRDKVGMVADALQSFVVDDLAPDLGASFAQDLLSSALGSVDWYEIAESLIEDDA
jgi:hypothetical protein